MLNILQLLSLLHPFQNIPYYTTGRRTSSQSETSILGSGTDPSSTKGLCRTQEENFRTVGTERRSLQQNRTGIGQVGATRSLNSTA